jgi:hypothetical protein
MLDVRPLAPLAGCTLAFVGEVRTLDDMTIAALVSLFAIAQIAKRFADRRSRIDADVGIRTVVLGT